MNYVLVDTVLKPIVSFMVGSISELMTYAMLGGLLYIALASELHPVLLGGR